MKCIARASQSRVHPTYNAAGNITQIIDPAGRTTNFIYAPNNIDLEEVDQVTGQGSVQIASYTGLRLRLTPKRRLVASRIHMHANPRGVADRTCWSRRFGPCSGHSVSRTWGSR